jgi:glucose/arabinose dehydrogenase
MALGPDGVLYATVRAEGRVVRLPDADGDGVADEAQTVAGDLQGVHGIAFKDGVLYAATETEVLRLEDSNGDHVADNRVIIVGDMPTGGTGRAGANHTTRTLRFGPDGKLYVSIGSSCNACLEEDPRRAAISRYTLDGTLEKVYAKGLRNSVGITFHPATGELWAVNNGRDGLGDELPPEGVYRVEEDADYGWPYCYGYRVTDTALDFPVPEGYCDKTGVPAFTLDPHSAPLGVTFYTGEQFPEEYRGDMFIGIHGSWDRSSPRGYKIVRVSFKDGEPDRLAQPLVQDFATGWLLADGTHWGRPVDLLVAPDGALFVTDDAGMAIYRIFLKRKT